MVSHGAGGGEDLPALATGPEHGVVQLCVVSSTATKIYIKGAFLNGRTRFVNKIEIKKCSCTVGPLCTLNMSMYCSRMVTLLLQYSPNKRRFSRTFPTKRQSKQYSLYSRCVNATNSSKVTVIFWLIIINSYLKSEWFAWVGQHVVPVQQVQVLRLVRFRHVVREHSLVTELQLTRKLWKKIGIELQ